MSCVLRVTVLNGEQVLHSSDVLNWTRAVCVNKERENSNSMPAVTAELQFISKGRSLFAPGLLETSLTQLSVRYLQQ